MERYCSTCQSAQRAVAPKEGEEEQQQQEQEEKEEEKRKRWMKWHWDMPFREYVRLPPSGCYHQRSISCYLGNSDASYLSS
jgi:threonine dehydrogenase-like Zn-dependent dehydrogenase